MAFSNNIATDQRGYADLWGSFWSIFCCSFHKNWHFFISSNRVSVVRNFINIFIVCFACDLLLPMRSIQLSKKCYIQLSTQIVCATILDTNILPPLLRNIATQFSVYSISIVWITFNGSDGVYFLPLAHDQVGSPQPGRNGCSKGHPALSSLHGQPHPVRTVPLIVFVSFIFGVQQIT